MDEKQSKAKALEANWKFYSSAEELKVLFKKFEDLMISGIPVNDQFGHNSTIQYRVRPQQTTIHNKIIESMPEGWCKNKSDFHRKKDAIGTECMLNLLLSRNIMEPEAVDRFSGFLMRMNAIARQEQEAALNLEFENLVMRLSHSGISNLNEIVADVKEIKGKMLEFNRERSMG